MVSACSTTPTPPNPLPTRPPKGDKRLFIRADELEAAWSLYTPLLHALEKQKVGGVGVVGLLRAKLSSQAFQDQYQI